MTGLLLALTRTPTMLSVQYQLSEYVTLTAALQMVTKHLLIDIEVIAGHGIPPGFNPFDSISETMNLIARNLVMPLANGFFRAPGERFYLSAGKNEQPKLFLPIYETPERLYLSAGDSMTQPDSNDSEAKEDCIDSPVGGSIREDEAPTNCIYLPPGDSVKSAKPRPEEPVKSSKPLPYSKLSHEDDNSNSSNE
ncbi:hypothetical protein J6590_072727 [Homalodisca vitripennis]|nr:hypothetical protein J6590_072727 [Homalodisca vitripennis]